MVSLSHTVCGIEMQILSFPWHLILREEMQQDTVHAAARIGGYT